MSRQDTERLIRHWAIDAIQEGRLEVFEDLLAGDVVDRTTEPPTRGRATFFARAEAVRRAFAEIAMTVDDVVVEGDAVAWRWTLEGRNAQGVRVRIRGVNFQRLRAGVVVEHWTLAAPVER